MGRRRRLKPARMRSVSRRRGDKTPTARMVVVMEGKVTEPQYLDVFRRCFGHRSVRLQLVRGVGDPNSVVKRAVEELHKLANDFLAGKDTVWVMFDRNSHTRFSESRRRAVSAGTRLAVSLPCFELWGVLHIRDQNAPLNQRGCQGKLEGLYSHYNRRNNKVFANEELVRTSPAIAAKRARQLLKFQDHNGTPGECPSTTVHELLEWYLRMDPARPESHV